MAAPTDTAFSAAGTDYRESLTMDEIVKKAMEKWPNVPHCYGWLMLDARGAWRMRDEATQAASLPGDKLAHVALLAFINRNYGCDAQGRWYFQNGPQRVYVNLEATPFIAHTDASGQFHVQTGALLEPLEAAWFTDSGQLLLQTRDKLALVDDRDLADCLPRLRLDSLPVDDAHLLVWIDGSASGTLTLNDRGQTIAIRRLAAADVAARFGFIRIPSPDMPAPA